MLDSCFRRNDNLRFVFYEILRRKSRLRMTITVIPAKAGIHLKKCWIPAFAGMTIEGAGVDSDRWGNTRDEGVGTLETIRDFRDY